MSKKYKSVKPEKTIHVEYTRAFYEILLYEEVQDIELGTIFQTYLKVIASNRNNINFKKPPKQADLNIIVNKVLDALGV